MEMRSPGKNGLWKDAPAFLQVQAPGRHHTCISPNHAADIKKAVDSCLNWPASSFKLRHTEKLSDVR